MTFLRIVLAFAGLLAPLAFAQGGSNQLIIINPLNNAILTANTTSSVNVTSSNSPTAGSVTVTTTFDCTSGIFTVTSEINENTPFEVPSNASGTCSVSASATSYTTSSIVTVFIDIPMYYEGTDENVLQSGQNISILVRPSNDAAFPTTFRIQCDNGASQNIPINTTITSLYTLPSGLTGNCTFTTPNPPSPYLPIEPVEVEIDAVISFAFPSQNTVFSANTFVTTRPVTSDGSNPTVTVELTCNGTLAATLTGPANTEFRFAPNPLIYGSCVLSLSEIENYFTDSTVDIGYKVTLSFAAPIPGNVVATGLPYDVKVTGTTGTNSISVLVSVTCAVGGSFNYTVNLNVNEQATMPSGYTGRCNLVATVDNIYFSSASTFVTSYVPLTPEQSAKFSQSIAVFGGTIPLTQ